MLKGDLTTTPLAPLLLSLARDSVTGCLHISDAEGDEALVYFKGGLVYAVTVPGRRPQLGARLVSSGALGPEALAEALEAQRTELQGWRLGELLVHLGYVDQPVVEAFVVEQVHDALWDLMRWRDGRWKFRRSEKTREDVTQPMTVETLLADLQARQERWEGISAIVHGPTAVPLLSARTGGAAEMALDADAWSLLCKIDGERSLAELARDCGYTIFECGAVIASLVGAGLVDVEDDLSTEQEDDPGSPDTLYGGAGLASAFATDSDGEQTDFSEIAQLVREVAAHAEVVADAEVAAHAEVADAEVAGHAEVVADSEVAAITEVAEPVVEVPSPVALRGARDEHLFSASIARVSAALSEVLGTPAPVDDPFVVPTELLPKRRTPETPEKPVRDPETERRDRLRAAAAAELASAHAMAEAMRRQAEVDPADDELPGATIVDLEAVRREAAEREAAEREAAEETARLEAERLAAEIAAAEEDAWAEYAEREAAAEAERLAAEIAAAEDEAWAEYAEREAAAEAERLAAEEAARLEAERLAAEIAAAEDDAWAENAEREAAAEAERLATEIAAAEDEAWAEYAEREAAAEAERLAAELAAAEDEAWAEYAEREAAAEAERLAAEEAARLEAERLATELAAAEEDAWAEYTEREAAAEAERLAAEEAARLEAERLAAEEAARLEAERLEAERLAAEEAERLAAEEAARLAAEEQARIAAEEAAAAEREAAAEFARLAAEQAEAEERARLEAELAAAAAAEQAAAEQKAAELLASEQAAAERAAVQGSPSDFAAASALLTELSIATVELQPEPQPVQPVVEEPSPQPAVASYDGFFGATPAQPAAPPAPHEMADTAALLRELSSLGFDDAPPAAAGPTPRVPMQPRPVTQAADKKKKRGLFGR